MSQTVVLLQTVAVPAAAAGVTALCTGMLRRRASNPALGLGAAPLLVGVAAGFFAVFGLPWPVESTWQWPVLAFTVAGLIALLVPARGRLAEVGFAALLGLAVAPVCWWMLMPLLPRFLDDEQHQWMVVVAAAAAALAAASAAFAARRISSDRLTAAFGAWSGAAALVLIAAGSARHGQVAGIAASAFGAIALLSWIRPQSPWLPRAVGPWVVLLAVAAVQHLGFGDEVEVLPMALLLAPGPVLGVWALLPRTRMPALVEATLLVVLSIAPLAWAWWSLTHAPASDPYGGYGG